jgi:hypothetical protein
VEGDIDDMAVATRWGQLRFLQLARRHIDGSAIQDDGIKGAPQQRYVSGPFA